MADFKIVVRRRCYSCGGTGKAGEPDVGGHVQAGAATGGASDDCPNCDGGWEKQTEDVTLEELLMALGNVSGRGVL